MACSEQEVAQMLIDAKKRTEPICKTTKGNDFPLSDEELKGYAFLFTGMSSELAAQAIDEYVMEVFEMAQ